MASLDKYIWGKVVINKMSADKAGWTVYGSASWTYVQRTLLWSCQLSALCKLFSVSEILLSTNFILPKQVIYSSFC